jgi:hypothetical protein
MWRFDNRKNLFLSRDTMLKLIHSDNLEYKGTHESRLIRHLDREVLRLTASSSKIFCLSAAVRLLISDQPNGGPRLHDLRLFDPVILAPLDR